jgi:hypothetical protein
MNDDKAAAPDEAKAPVPPAAPPVEKDIADKKPEELTPEDLRILADTMPGDGPGDD